MIESRGDQSDLRRGKAIPQRIEQLILVFVSELAKGKYDFPIERKAEFLPALPRIKTHGSNIEENRVLGDEMFAIGIFHAKKLFTIMAEMVEYINHAIEVVVQKIGVAVITMSMEVVTSRHHLHSIVLQSFQLKAEPFVVDFFFSKNSFRPLEKNDIESLSLIPEILQSTIHFISSLSQSIVQERDERIRILILQKVLRSRNQNSHLKMLCKVNL